ncbi:hypothetical protein E0Z10_g880 [Xylaria hypoxylon]|uniref:Uncharacterized protein n=1 Tax=Xylaria hypoxylon TaxID=37992 RepID=A0A4Z0YU47_9PEZI|nr:hypothetical protein E0Z10_g880 [Xylaria hypoxylon]
MRYHSAIAATIGAAAVVRATPPTNDHGIRSELHEGYKIEPLAWRGVIEKGGPEFSFNGTVDEVTRQIQAVKTDFTWESLRRDLGISNTLLRERGGKAGIICDIGGEDTSPHGPLTANVEESRDKIEEMAGTCAVAAGPGVCSVVACTRNAAVWLCNDNDAPIAPPCSSLASYVTDIVGKCGLEYYHGSRHCKGQEFDSDNFNVVVGWNSQC